MLTVDLQGRRALVAGVADDGGFGFAIAKCLAEAGASVCVGTWPPALGIFETLLRRGKIDESRRLSSGALLEFERIYPLDAAYDTLDAVPEEIRANKRYAERGDFTIDGLAKSLLHDFGDQPLDILVHSLANGPEVKKPLLETSRSGYLAAVSVSAYSLVGMVQRLGPAHASRRLGRVAHVHGERAGDPRLRWRDVFGEGGARERHARPRLRGGAQDGAAREHDFRQARSPRAPRARSGSSTTWCSTG